MLTKLASRKLWVTLLALAGVTVQGTNGADWWQQLVVGLLAASYVVAQAFVDGRTAANPLEQYGDVSIAELEKLLESLKTGLAQGRQQSSDLVSTAGDVGALTPTAAVDPQLIVMIVQLFEKLIGLFKRRK